MKKKKLTKKELEMYKKILLDKKMEILNKVKKRMQTGDSTSSEVMDIIDQATDSYEKELAYGLTDSEKKSLDEIEEALKKIEEKTYGICIICGGLIDSKRLKTLPAVNFCIKCQQNIEKKQQ
jgi:DnaK suppressor protein